MNEKIIYKIRTGSHLYGLNTPESDEDYGGLVLPTPRQLLGIHKVKEIDMSSEGAKKQTRNTKDDTDEKYYTLDKFLSLLTNMNPNIVEYLFSPEYIVDSEVMQELRENYEKIVCKKVWWSFSGYAYAQRKKMVVKKERYQSLVSAISWLESQFELLFRFESHKIYPITEELSEELNAKIKYYKGKKENCESFHKGMDLHMIYGKLVDERDRYGWRVHTSSFMELGYDCKFGYHIIRLLHEGRQLLETGKLTFPIEGSVKEDIMRIRNAEVPYEELLTMYDGYYKLCEEAYKNTTLRENPDFAFIDTFQYKTYLEHIKKEE